MQPLRIIFILCITLAGSLTALPARALAFDFRPLETVVEKAVSDSVFPGASLAVLYKGKVVFHKAFGKMTYKAESSPVDTTTIYDLASLTKAISTTSIVMQLVDRDSLSLQSQVSRYLLDFGCNGKERVTIAHLLRHTSGLRAHSYFAKNCASPSDLFRAIETDTLLSPPGTTTLYSDLGFILLGKIVATITGKSLAANFHARFAVPLGLHSTMFTPPASILKRVAPVEQDTLWPFRTPRPLVHDQNAALLGGVAGHAGLYSTTGDLITFTRMLMHGGTSGRRIYFRKETLRNFLSRSSAERALGWDLRTAGSHSSAGEFFSPASYGHLGYTGTSIWIDPQQDLAVILLSNRVWPTSANIKIRKFRPLLHNTVAECLLLKRF